MPERSEIQETTHKPPERRNETCTASVGLSATLAAGTILLVAVVVALLLLLT
jgi:hypothetical protein